MIWALLLLCDTGATEFKVEDLKGKEVSITATVAKTGRAPTVYLRRRSAGIKSGAAGEYFIHETWMEDALSKADETKDRWTAEVRIKMPGSYDFMMGQEVLKVGLSRSNFEGWDSQLRDFESMIEKVIETAKTIDKEGNDKAVFTKCARNLNAEKIKLAKMKTEFSASHQAVRSAIDNLLLQWSLLDLLGKHFLETGEYGMAKDGDLNRPPTALLQVEKLGDFVAKEVTLKLIDELLLLIADGGEPRKVIRWPSRTEGLKAITEAAEKHKAQPELIALLKGLPPEEVIAPDAPPKDPKVQDPYWDPTVKRAQAIRAKLAR